MSNVMTDNSGKLARSSTLKLFKLCSNHCADDPMKGLESSEPKSARWRERGKVRGRKKGNREAGTGMHIVVSGSTA